MGLVVVLVSARRRGSSSATLFQRRRRRAAVVWPAGCSLNPLPIRTSRSCSSRASSPPVWARSARRSPNYHPAARRCWHHLDITVSQVESIMAHSRRRMSKVAAWIGKRKRKKKDISWEIHRFGEVPKWSRTLPWFLGMNAAVPGGERGFKRTCFIA